VVLKNVSKKYVVRSDKPLFAERFGSFGKKEEYWALKEVNLSIKSGERIGIFGDNGAGKTTLLKIISGITMPTEGTVRTFGKVVSIIDIAAGFNPEISGRNNMFLNGLLLDMSRSEIHSKMNQIIDFSELGDFIDQPLYTYSSGMILRLGFSIAIHSNPQILILDENIVVGDQDFQKKLYDEVELLFAQGMTIIFSSHLLPALKRLCTTFIWMEKGKVKKIGNEEIVREYRNNRKAVFQEKIPSQQYGLLYLICISCYPWEQ
jgi:ABC-type polysaccharide/polyol phosphate transport system ATPase subunit